MKAFYSLGMALLALTTTGCATTGATSEHSTYSGEVRAAVAKQTASASNYVRGLFSKPMPTWQPAIETKAIAPARDYVSQPSPAESRAPADSVQTHPVDLGPQ